LGDRFGQILQPRRHVHPFTVNLIALDHLVTEVRSMMSRLRGWNSTASPSSAASSSSATRAPFSAALTFSRRAAASCRQYPLHRRRQA
jgi:hypothetical protein